MPPKVTVCIPTYNRADLLREAIQSVVDQTYTDLEVIVSDNASTDGTREVVASFHDPRIRYHRHSQNVGMMNNFRSAVMKANTDLVAILPDDDLYLPDHLQSGLNALTAYSQAVFYTSAAQYFGEHASGIMRPKAIMDTETPLLYFEPRRAIDFLGIDNPGPMHCVCKREAFDQDLYWGHGDFPTFDLLILTQLMVQGGFVFGNRPTTRFRVHSGSTTLGNITKRHILRFNCMVWFSVRWLALFLLSRKLCTLADIENHGLHASSPNHVVPLVLALGSFDSPPVLRDIAKRVFCARKDMDKLSARFQVARRLGFSIIPIAEKMTQFTCNWHPPVAEARHQPQYTL